MSSGLIEAVSARRADPSLRIDMQHWATPATYEPLSERDLEAAEMAMGLELPALMRRLYLEVGNGGFGPGGGLLGIGGGSLDDDGNDLVALRASMLTCHHIERLLPVCAWGCGAWSCILCDEHDVIATCDQQGVFSSEMSFAGWMAAWCAGVNLYDTMYEFEEYSLTDPFTGAAVPTRRRVRTRGAPLVRW